MGLHNIHLDLTEQRNPLVVVDGVPVDLSKVSRITVDAVGRDFPKIYLEVPVEGTVVVEGVVVERVVTEAPSLNASEVLKAFLSKLDPTTLESAILAEFDGMDGMSTGQAALNVLTRYADGNVART